MRGTDAATLYSISLIRTGTTNKTSWCAKKQHRDVPRQEAVISASVRLHANDDG